MSVCVSAHDDGALACTQRRGAAATRRRLRLAGDLRGGLVGESSQEVQGGGFQPICPRLRVMKKHWQPEFRMNHRLALPIRHAYRSQPLADTEAELWLIRFAWEHFAQYA